MALLDFELLGEGLPSISQPRSLRLVIPPSPSPSALVAIAVATIFTLALDAFPEQYNILYNERKQT